MLQATEPRKDLLGRISPGSCCSSPLSLGRHYLTGIGPVWIFGFGVLAIVPLAEWIRRATENLAARVGPAVGGLLLAVYVILGMAFFLMQR